MYIELDQELKELADIFGRNGEKLYIVGGYIRDKMLNLTSATHNDIDLCSAVRPDKVEAMLKGTRFATDNANKIYGTTIINGNKRYEHTTFRRENYNLNGEHNPTGVEFIKDLRTDALRRDFTINAIYYDIQTGDIIDPVEGVKHLKQKLLVSPINATDSFMEDSERILRMIRFACTFGLEIEEKTLLAGYNCSSGIENLSKQRIKKEFDKMLICDGYYLGQKQSEYAHAKCMILLGQLDIWKYILPAMDHIMSSGLKDEKGEEIYSHIINTFGVCEPNARLACLLHDCGKVVTKQEKNNFNFSDDWAKIIIEENLGANGLMYPKKVVSDTKRIIKAIDFDKHGWESKKNVKRFIRDNFDIFDQICALKDAISLENTEFKFKSKIANRWKRIYAVMRKYHTPLIADDLEINGADLLSVMPDLDTRKIGELISKLIDYCLSHPKNNKKEILLARAKKIVLKDVEYYLGE